MNKKLGILDDYHNPELPPPIDAHDQLLPVNLVEGEICRKPPTPRPHEYCRVYDNITHSDGPLVFPPLPHGHTFVVTSSLMQMLTARGLFSRIPSKDTHAHIAKVRSVCKSCAVGPMFNLKIVKFLLGMVEVV